MTLLSQSRKTTFSTTWLHRWIYYLATGFMFGAAALRAVLLYQQDQHMGQFGLWLGAWLVLYLLDVLLASRLPKATAILIGLEVFVILQLLRITQEDFCVYLLAISAMQTMQQFTIKEAIAAVVLTTLLAFLSLYQKYGIFSALGIATSLLGGSIFLVIYIDSTRRLQKLQDDQQKLARELQQANMQLESYTEKADQLAAGRERQHLARELHDSVTQTIFSMTLNTQSALLLLEKDRKQVGTQLLRLDELSRSALGEMQVLISRLAPKKRDSLVEALQRHLFERRRLEGLQVNLDVQGNRHLSIAEEQGLFRIIQEALNNVVKHAGVNQATIKVSLNDQPWLEVVDEGVGFEQTGAQRAGRLGLVGMQERAEGMGWIFQVASSPGKGTRVRVWKDPRGGKGDEHE